VTSGNFYEPEVVLIFGPPASGKSVLARLIAGRFAKCAHVEVDALRYMVVGGLVAYSAGIHSTEAREEYERQCHLGVENAVRLAHGFASHGFSSVIEGLGDECLPGSGWSRQSFPTIRVCNVLVICDLQVLSKRWGQRGWGMEIPKAVRDSIQRFESARTQFDCVLDTSSGSPETNAERVWKELRRRAQEGDG